MVANHINYLWQYHLEIVEMHRAVDSQEPHHGTAITRQLVQVVKQQATGHTEDTLRDSEGGREPQGQEGRQYVVLTGLHSRVRDIDNKVEDTGLRRTNL